MTHWKQIQKLNGGEPIYNSEPKFDMKDEVWFLVGTRELRVSSAGVLHKFDKKAHEAKGPITGRFTLYRLREKLFVDVEVRGEQAVVRRGILNGADVSTRIAPSEVEPLLARYRAFGFKDGFPWNATKTLATRREYHRQKPFAAWTVEVHGNVLVDSARDTPAPSHEAAIALAEKRIRAKEKAGFRLYLIELMTSDHPNPEPKPPKGAPARNPLPKRAPVPKPKDAYEAVDAAVAMLEDLHERIPTAHFVTECLDLEADRKRVASVEEHAAFFLRMHKARVGRWAKAKPRKPKKNESSWDYFANVYGSITWILDGAADAGLEMFYCGNVTGGGWSCLEIDSDSDYSMDDQVEATGNEELENLFVFHGGWHQDRSWAFDQRVSSPGGEYAVIPFGDNLQDLPRPVKPERIVPFGLWLYKRVVALTRIAETNLRELG
ncbi:hypothetical protein [Pyxidicoccus sp. MSG2]|uniref:hypothetical protein n=1 Tax=Pyxidicoccus sp. MSG2 TaxID=2996790 RepID=UPI00226D61D0|nr:hypothetical protein [Pyxidicoccus sp. MSG2]MCY1017093.1 hypothetical protein [Pyxidicoccus sp. MSG2]